MMLDSGLTEAARNAIADGRATFIHKGMRYEVVDAETLQLTRIERIGATRRKGGKPHEKRRNRAAIPYSGRRFKRRKGYS